MDDLFPGTQRPDALGADAMLYSCPVFFALYPSEGDLPRVVEWQQGIRRRFAPSMAPRPAELLHVSVAECGKPKRQRQALPDAFAEAARHFSFPAFTVSFHAFARFGKDGRACVAVADAESQRIVHALRAAIADAQRHAGQFVSRGGLEAHLTLGYGNDPVREPQVIEPFGFRVDAVDLVVSEVGRSRHRRLQRWALDSRESQHPRGW